MTMVAASALVLAACGAGDDSASSSVEPSVGSEATSAGTGDISGAVSISGSSTVEPISSAVAEAFRSVNSGVEPSVDGPGTGDGFKLFCAGDTDISDASRPIKDDEAAACTEAGVNYVELKVGIDGLTVATSPKNSVECLDIPALYALTGPESTGFDNWSAAKALAAELGSKSVLPDAALDIYGPGEESGTYDSYVEFAIRKLAEARGKTGADVATRPDYNSSPNDNTIIEGIEGSDSSLGWVGYAYYKEQGSKIADVAIDAGKGCVKATDDTIATGTYPFSRALYIYVNVDKAKANPAVKGFVDYYLSDAGIGAVAQVGYISLPSDQLAASRAAWKAAAA
jgi:phosphate transport system substrate-binding protein